MHKPITAALIAGLVAMPLAAARVSPDEQLAKLLQGRVAGKPVGCIDMRPGQDMVKIRGTAVAYRDGSTWYVNHFSNGCPDLNDDTIMVTRSSIAQFCRGDIVTLKTNSPPYMVAGSCVFDDFVPYRKAG
jgi:hypothetical protein